MTTPAGWYPDPAPGSVGRERWWDGRAWSEQHVRPSGQAPVQAAPQASPAWQAAPSMGGYQHVPAAQAAWAPDPTATQVRRPADQGPSFPAAPAPAETQMRAPSGQAGQAGQAGHAGPIAAPQWAPRQGDAEVPSVWVDYAAGKPLPTGAFVMKQPSAAPPPIRPTKATSPLVWKGQLEAGDLPPICVLTGERATVWKKKKVAFTPEWVRSTIILAYLPFLILKLIYTRKAVALVPLSETGVAKLKKRLIIWVALTVVGAALCGVGFGLQLIYIWIPGLVVLFAAVIAWAVWLTWLPVWISEDTQVVQLLRVNTDFATSLTQAYHR